MTRGEEQRVQAVAGKAGSDVCTWQGFSHARLFPGPKVDVSIHSKDLGKGLVAKIKSQLGLK